MNRIVTQAVCGKLRPEAARKGVARFGGQDRYLWNHFTKLNNERMREQGKFIYYKEMSAMLPKLLKEDPKLAGFPHRCAQMCVMRFDRTLKHYIRHKTEFARIDARRKARSDARVARGLPPLKPHKAGIPQFKSHDDRRDTFSFVGRECRFARRRIRLPKLGWLRVTGLDLPENIERIAQVVISQAADGWSVSVQFDAPVKDYRTPTEPTVGIDRGLKALAAFAEEKVAPPKYGRGVEQRIRRLNRKRDRRSKGSVNRRRAIMSLAKLHQRTARKRKAHLHLLTRKMVDTFNGFAVEDLNLKGLMKTRLAKSFAGASLGELVRQLRYKAEWARREWRVMARFCRSTGVCPDPACGWVGPRLRPGIETWTCEGCGVVHDRDLAAGRVILRDATVVRAAGVAPPRREPSSALRKKRGPVARDGGEAAASPSHVEPPSNVDLELVA